MPRIHTIAEVLQSFRLKTNTPAAVIQKSYESFNNFRHLNAFTFVSAHNNLQKQISQLNISSKSAQLPLYGIPVAIKDNFCVQGLFATCGSKMLQSFISPYTATVVQKLIDAGAIVFGKTNMDEFGMGCGTLDSIFGPTKNVWGLEAFRTGTTEIDSFTDWRIPGGSSGGSAVAVASGICFAALGSDTGGSTRNPASYCGVVGLKPTYGLLSRLGLIPLVNSMDVPGIITRTVEDCASVFNVVKGFDENDPTSYEEDLPPVQIKPNFFVEGLRIGSPKEFACADLSPEVKDCWKMTSDILSNGGAIVSPVSLPHTKYSIACYGVLNPCEVASNMARYDGLRYGHRTPRPKSNSTEGLYSQSRHEGFNNVVRGRILAGNYFLLKSNYDKYFMQALKVRRLITQDFENVWKNGIDLLLTPVTLSAAPTYSDFIKLDSRTQTSVQDYCTQSVNMAGVPAVSLPIKLNGQGLPLSLQLIGPKFSEDKLLNVAKYIEEFVKFPHYVTIDRTSKSSSL